MKKDVIAIGLIFLVILLGFCGCTEQKSSYANIQTDQSIGQTITPYTESVESILEKTETIESIYYEIIAMIEMSDFGTQEATIKIWKKDPHLKEEILSTTNGITATISVIHRPEGIYKYDTQLNDYRIATDEFTSVATTLQYFDSEMIKNYLNNQSLNDFETEIIDGKKTTIIEYNPSKDENQMDIKIWIWNEKGVPLKANIDMAFKDATMSMNFLFSNYSFSDISDDIYSIS